MYALRRTRDAFREHKDEADQRKIQEFVQDGIRNLHMMKVRCLLAVFLVSYDVCG